MIVGFAGSGNMAAAMARGWMAAEVRPAQMLFTDAGSGRAALLAAEVGGEAVSDNGELAKRADIVFLSFKPKDLEGAAAELQAAPAVISMLNGTSCGHVARLFGAAETLRLMPNLAVEHRRGVLGLVVPKPSARAEAAERLLGALGKVFLLDDDGIDALTAVAGCSPAYFDLFVDALAAAGAAAGLDPEAARMMVIETMAGSAELIESRAAGELRRQVASPGGSTEAGLESLERDGFAAVVGRAAEASLARMRGEI